MCIYVINFVTQFTNMISKITEGDLQMQQDRIDYLKEFLEYFGKSESPYEHDTIKGCDERITTLQTETRGRHPNWKKITDIYGRIAREIDKLYKPYLRDGILLKE